MTITLTKEEIEGFAANLEQWYASKSEYVLTNFLESVRGGREFGQNTRSEIQRWVAKFEETHPKPDWRKQL